MKHTIYLIAIVALFTACKQKISNTEATEEVTATSIVTDSNIATVQEQTQTVKKTDTANSKINTIAKNSEIPKDGTYAYTIRAVEPPSTIDYLKITVRIKGDSIIAIVKESGGDLKKGDIYESGVLVKHKKSGQWIIAHNPKDKFADDVGGCSDGPTVIYFKNKTIEAC